MLKRAIVMAFHKYTPFGSEFYEPMLDFQLKTLKKYTNEFDRIYFIDSTWDIKGEKITEYLELPQYTIIKVNPHFRYYNAYKQRLPQIAEDLVLFMDDDMIVYKKGIIEDAFGFLTEGFGVVSIYDTCGTHSFEKLGGQNKFCPYFFCTKKSYLMKYLDVEWGPEMPEYETLGRLTHRMLDDRVNPYEFEEDKTSIYFDGIKDNEKGKDLGYYHIRSGSVPAYLLATREYGNSDTYLSYIHNQPKNEYLRQAMWYTYMGGDFSPVLSDLRISPEEWNEYKKKFIKYHNLP